MCTWSVTGVSCRHVCVGREAWEGKARRASCATHHPIEAGTRTMAATAGEAVVASPVLLIPSSGRRANGLVTDAGRASQGG